ncbi:hypothetical protein [Halorarius litoreus]|uniref:DUF7856 family protein n=1 Tax=Halorarius litoreus TaxID=2962676 RepID=UPI0020CEED1D|nr:hypothetical protein [Halorarius litoreus]
MTDVPSFDSGAGLLDRRSDDVPPERLVTAIRDPAADLIDCPTPGPAHEQLGWLRHGMPLNRRAAFAAVARSRGWTAPQLDELVAVARQLRDLDAGPTALADAREQVATAGSERDRLRERAATLRGAVRARREAGLDATEAADELVAVGRKLSEATTEREAARQALDRERTRARDAYDRRERRLELQDRAANLQREARATLAERVRPDVVTALDDLDAPDLDDATDPTVALAAATVAAFDAPVVVELEAVDTAHLARAFDVPVVRL